MDGVEATDVDDTGSEGVDSLLELTAELTSGSSPITVLLEVGGLAEAVPPELVPEFLLVVDLLVVVLN